MFFSMADRSVNHARLSAKISGQLYQALKNRKCAVLSGDLMIGYYNENYDYADASVICGKPEIHADNKNEVKNLCLIVVVLSNETAEYDKGEKFKLYQKLNTFVKYVLIS